jgi:hypothetical protein
MNMRPSGAQPIAVGDDRPVTIASLIKLGGKLGVAVTGAVGVGVPVRTGLDVGIGMGVSVGTTVGVKTAVGVTRG